MKQKFVLLASLAIGLLAALLAHAWLNAKRGEVDKLREDILRTQRVVKVIGAGKALPRGTVIEEEDLVALRVFERSTTDDNIELDARQQIVGRRLNYSIERGAPILWTYLEGGRGMEHNLSDEIQAGMRAVSIPVSGAAAVAGHVRPNDHVDVLGMFALPEDGNDENAQLVTLTVLQNVTVLATGSDTARTISAARSRAGYSTVTLLVTPREAEILVFAQQMKGRLFLTLRNARDVYTEAEMPRVNFARIEGELKALNEARQSRNQATRRPGASSR